jgi:hypothetical protein
MPAAAATCGTLGQLLPAAVFYNEGGADVLDRPGRREAARGHSASSAFRLTLTSRLAV